MGDVSYFIDLAVFGVVQGLTEFLPVSSSGHLVIAQELLGYKPEGIALEITLHLATLLAVLIFYWRRIVYIVFRNRDKLGWLLFIAKILVATVPAALVGLLFKDQIEALFESFRMVGFALLFTALVLASTLLARKRGKTLAEIGFGAALLIGCAQAIAIVPGVSRSGMTIAVALWFGIMNKDAAAFSFILSIPAIAGAGLLTATDFVSLDVPVIPLAVSFLLALITGVLAIFIVVKALENKRFAYFAIYCGIIGISVLAVSYFFPGLIS
ncbi:MAG: undecaprenyl-diphosphate phosphatase [bacterium]|nr:undecaprenyl-diphosphate phosphatase [bacterium]